MKSLKTRLNMTKCAGHIGYLVVVFDVVITLYWFILYVPAQDVETVLQLYQFIAHLVTSVLYCCIYHFNDFEKIEVEDLTSQFFYTVTV